MVVKLKVKRKRYVDLASAPFYIVVPVPSRYPVIHFFWYRYPETLENYNSTDTYCTAVLYTIIYNTSRYLYHCTNISTCRSRCRTSTCTTRVSNLGVAQLQGFQKQSTCQKFERTKFIFRVRLPHVYCAIVKLSRSILERQVHIAK